MTTNPWQANERHFARDAAYALTDAFAAFCELGMTQRNLSPLTRATYRRDVQRLLDQLAKADIARTDQLDTRAIQAFLSRLDGQGLLGNTRRRILISTKAFLSYLEAQGLVHEGFADRLIWPMVERADPRPLSERQYQALQLAARHHPRDAAIIEVLLQTGIRLGELTALTLDDLTLPERPSKDPERGGGELHVRRKGRRIEDLALNYKACLAIKAYLRARPATGEQRLFLTKYGTPMTNRSVEKAIKKYAVEAGVPWAHTHTLRTTHITMHFAKGTDTRTIQANAGHASLATTNRYAAYVKDSAKRKMQENAL